MKPGKTRCLWDIQLECIRVCTWRKEYDVAYWNWSLSLLTVQLGHTILLSVRIRICHMRVVTVLIRK